MKSCDWQPVEDIQDEELRALVNEAKRFLYRQPWCRTITKGYVAEYFPGILVVCYFEVVPASGSGADEAVWVIVGDLPPAYLDLSVQTPKEALEAYIGAMEEWIDCVRRGEPVDEVIPVYYRDSVREVPPTEAFAEMLASRLKFIEEKLLPELDSDT